MGKILPITILLFFFICSFAQNDSTVIRQKERKWEIGFTVSPAYSYRVLTPLEHLEKKTFYNSSYGQIRRDKLANSLNSVEKGKTAITIGLALAYSLNHFFSLSTGFSYSDKGFVSQGWVYSESISHQYYLINTTDLKINNFYFYEVPVSLNCSLNLDSAGKRKIYFFAGLSSSLNSNEFTYSSRRWMKNPFIAEPQLSDESNFTPLTIPARSIFYLGYSGGIGLSIKCRKRLKFNFEPVIKYYAYPLLTQRLRQATLDSYFLSPHIFEVIEKPYSFGCNIRINYCF